MVFLPSFLKTNYMQDIKLKYIIGCQELDLDYPTSEDILFEMKEYCSNNNCLLIPMSFFKKYKKDIGSQVLKLIDDQKIFYNQTAYQII